MENLLTFTANERVIVEREWARLSLILQTIADVHGVPGIWALAADRSGFTALHTMQMLSDLSEKMEVAAGEASKLNGLASSAGSLLDQRTRT
jgi:folate-dependent tRNA-U54 methylase TrmFO/GidA